MRATWRFRPPLWAALSVLAAVAFFCSMGMWQIHRGQAKQVLLDQYAVSVQAPPRVLDFKQPASAQITHVSVSGRYEGSHPLLLDNQSHQQRPGYQVWTPLRLESGELILVNRGWIPLTNRAELPTLPAPEGLQKITGYWQPLPVAGMKLAPAHCARAEKFPQIVNYPTAQEIACLIGESVQNGELLLDADMPDGFVRAWTFDNGLPPTRHYGYALQWFALALTLVIIFLKLNIKRNSTHE